MRRRAWELAAAVAAMCAWWGGCATPVTETPAVDVPVQFGEQGGTVEPPERWWTAWGDAELTQRIDRALAANLSLEAVWQSLQEAEAVARRTGASRWPELEASAGGSDRREAGVSEREYGAGLAAAYEVDLWRRVGAAAAAADFRAEAAYTDLQAAALSLSAEVAVSYFQLIEARQQRELLQDQLATNEKVLRSQRARFSGGLVRSADVLRQQQVLERNRGQLALVELEMAVLEHRLAVLQGQPPSPVPGAIATSLPTLPAMPRTGVPAELLQRRPDVQAALARLRAANAELAAAVAERYPRITLRASLDTVADRPSALFDDWIRNLAGQVVAPLFDAGNRQAEVERNEAIARRRLAEYGQTVLEALRETEDALVRERRQAERIASLEAQARLAQQSYQRLLNEYLNGVTDFLDALTALNQVQQLQRDVLEARRVLAEYRVGVYRALAGGIAPDRSQLAQAVSPEA